MAVVNQKQYTRHSLKKLNKMTAWEVATRIKQLNKWFKYLPANTEAANDMFQTLGEYEI